MLLKLYFICLIFIMLLLLLCISDSKMTHDTIFFFIIIKIGKQSLLYMVIDLTSEIWACHYNKWSLNGVKWVTLCVLLGFYWDFYFKWTVKRYKSRSDERWTIKCRTMKEMMKRRWQRAKLKVSYSWFAHLLEYDTRHTFWNVATI